MKKYGLILLKARARYNRVYKIIDTYEVDNIEHMNRFNDYLIKAKTENLDLLISFL
jgi:hypothetical protein